MYKSLLLFRHTNRASATTSSLSVLTTYTETPVVTQTSVSANLLHPLQVLAQFRVQVGTRELRNHTYEVLEISCDFINNHVKQTNVNNFISVALVPVIRDSKEYYGAIKMYSSAVTVAQATSWTYNEHLHDQSWICAMEFAWYIKDRQTIVVNHRYIFISTYLYVSWLLINTVIPLYYSERCVRFSKYMILHFSTIRYMCFRTQSLSFSK